MARAENTGVEPDLLAAANELGDSVSVLLGNADGTFLAKADYTVGAAPRSLTVADVNGDGKLDLLVANRTSGDVSLLLGVGDGTTSWAMRSPRRIANGSTRQPSGWLFQTYGAGQRLPLPCEGVAPIVVDDLYLGLPLR